MKSPRSRTRTAEAGRSSSSRLLLSAATMSCTVAAVLTMTASSCSALQPQQQPLVPQRTSSTRLAYVQSAPVASEVGTRTRSSTRNRKQQEQDVKDLEKLLQMEYNSIAPLQLEVGVTSPAPLKEEKASPRTPVQPKKKKRLTITQTTNGRRKSADSKDATTTASSRLKANLSHHGKRKTVGKAKRSTTASDTTPASFESFYYGMTSPDQKPKPSFDGTTTTTKKRTKKTPLLTKEEEIVLTERIRALRAVEQVRDEQLMEQCFLEEIDGEDVCSITSSYLMRMSQSFTEADWATACGLESTQALQKIIRQGQAARSHLIQSNIGLVVSIAKKHHSAMKMALEAGNGVGTILTLQDCLQEGQIGLIKAAERFDPARNVRFSTYATWWIRQRILGAIRDTSRIIRLPAHVHTMLMKTKKARKQMQAEIGREPSIPELAHYMEVPVAKLQQYTSAALNVVSLENPLRMTHNGKSDGQDTRTLGDSIASDAPTPLEDAQRESLRRDLHQVLLDHLTDTERAVLVARFGLEDGDSKTLEETARVVGVSRERVRLVETKALNKLRSPQRNYRLQTYVGEGSGSGGSSSTSTSTSSTKSATMASSSDTPWRNHRESVATEEDIMANPFGSPLDYANRKTTASKRSKVKLSSSSSSSNGKHLKKSTLDHVYFGGSSRRGSSTVNSGDNDENQLIELSAAKEQEAMASAPDRLWFF